jgi:hypothetical protein
MNNDDLIAKLTDLHLDNERKIEQSNFYMRWFALALSIIAGSTFVLTFWHIFTH